MKLFGTVKDQKGVRTYFFGLKVYEERKLPHSRKTYVLGIRTRKKKYVSKSNDAPATIAMQRKIEWNTRMAHIELNLLTYGLYYRDLPEDERYVLCFDALQDPNIEAIDAWSFFQYLQEKGIPCKYAIRRENDLYKKLKAENRLKDILPVSSELQLLTDYPHEIAQSRYVLSSFAFDLGPIFKRLPYLKFIFIEHGVTYYSGRSTNFYTNDKFDGILAPTKLTSSLYDSMHQSWDSCKVYQCGIPRWDRLPIKSREEKRLAGPRKIFIFFTYRVSFRKDNSQRTTYMNRIKSLVTNLGSMLEKSPNVELHIALHHTLFLQDSSFEGWKHTQGVHLVPYSEISTIIKDADMCITDYSSVSFDFLYRNVPVIYYCLDADVNYVDPRDQIAEMAERIKTTFYNCCTAEAEALAKVQHYVNRDFELESEYFARNEEIFWPRGNNCESLWQMLNGK